MREYGEWSLLPNRSSASAMLAEYVGESAQRSDPRFFTAGADLSCLPPLFLAAAEVDVFRDSSVLLAERAERAGATVELAVYPGVSHLFWGYSRMVDTSHACTRAIASFLEAKFAGEGAGHHPSPVLDRLTS
jgi:acetyl esterase